MAASEMPVDGRRCANVNGHVGRRDAAFNRKHSNLCVVARHQQAVPVGLHFAPQVSAGAFANECPLGTKPLDQPLFSQKAQGLTDRHVGNTAFVRQFNNGGNARVDRPGARLDAPPEQRGKLQIARHGALSQSRCCLGVGTGFLHARVPLLQRQKHSSVRTQTLVVLANNIFAADCHQMGPSNGNALRWIYTGQIALVPIRMELQSAYSWP